MHVKAIKTHKITTKDNLEDFLNTYLRDICENDIIAITSKVISIMEKRLIKKGSTDKRGLIFKEADYVLETEHNPYDIYLTIKNNILIPTAGIDESNVENAYVLYPVSPQKSAERIWRYLRKTFNIKNLGVLITDSHTTIMRRGISGLAIAWCGFEPLYSYIGKPDLYNNPLKVTQINLLDSLAAASVYLMGEGNEAQPIAIVKDAPKINFLDRPPRMSELKEITISIDEDLYSPLLKAGKWMKTR